MVEIEEANRIFQRQIMAQTEKANKEIQRKLSAQAILRLRSFDKQFGG